MGFRREATVVVKFDEDHELHGFEVRLHRASMQDVERYMRYVETPDDTSKPPHERLAEPIELIAPALISWNYETDGGTPVTPDEVGLWRCDSGMIAAIMHGWISASSQVSRPLSQPSRDGEQFPEQSIPMEVG